MNLQGIRENDLIEANVKGRRFFARVREVRRGSLDILPITPSISYRTVTARQVTAWFKRMGRKRANNGDS